LRLTLSNPAGMTRYARQMRQALKLSGMKSELKLVLPGKVLTSSFPNTQDNTTSFTIDSQKDESLDAAFKFYTEPAVVTAELGGLKLDHPLDSKSVRPRVIRGADPASNLPITDAGPGFVAEAMSVSTTTLHLFPEGRKHTDQMGMMGTQATNSAVVTAKLFPPKGRIMQTVSDVRVLKAVDDKGRSVAAAVAADDEDSFESFAFSGGSERANSARVQLRLQLPEPDAQAIDEISAEAIALTAGSWKEITLTNLAQSVSNEIDIATVLPGAKLVITKFNPTNQQIQLQADLKGPPAIRQLDVQMHMPGNNQFNSNASDRRFRTAAGQSTRSIWVQGYAFGEEGAATGQVVLVIRCPQDLRRERVTIKLKGLDLM
jgi:hypothetical protein